MKSLLFAKVTVISYQKHFISEMLQLELPKNLTNTHNISKSTVPYAISDPQKKLKKTKEKQKIFKQEY